MKTQRSNQVVVAGFAIALLAISAWIVVGLSTFDASTTEPTETPTSASASLDPEPDAAVADTHDATLVAIREERAPSFNDLVSEVEGAKASETKDGVNVATLSDGSRYIAIAGPGDGVAGFIPFELHLTTNPIASLKNCEAAAGIGAKQCDDVRIAAAQIDRSLFGKHGAIVRELKTLEAIGEVTEYGYFSNEELENGTYSKAAACGDKARSEVERTPATEENIRELLASYQEALTVCLD